MSNNHFKYALNECLDENGYVSYEVHVYSSNGFHMHGGSEPSKKSAQKLGRYTCKRLLHLENKFGLNIKKG